MLRESLLLVAIVGNVFETTCDSVLVQDSSPETILAEIHELFETPLITKNRAVSLSGGGVGATHYSQCTSQSITGTHTGSGGSGKSGATGK